MVWRQGGRGSLSAERAIEEESPLLPFFSSSSSAQLFACVRTGGQGERREGGEGTAPPKIHPEATLWHGGRKELELLLSRRRRERERNRGGEGAPSLHHTVCVLF